MVDKVLWQRVWKGTEFYINLWSLLASSNKLPSVFNHPELNMEMGRALNENFSKTMRKMWVQFAKTGNPSLNAEQSPDGKAKEWPRYDLTNRTVMVFEEFNIHLEKESSLKIIDWDRTGFLSKYY